MRSIFKWVTKHLLILLLGSIVYALSFHLDFLSFSGIYYYDGIVRLLVVVFILAVVVWSGRKILAMDYKDVVLAVCLFALVNMLWLSLCVVSLDRSLSVFMLTYMQGTENITSQGMTEEEIDNVFEKIFVEEYGMLERRFEEQLASGNIVCTNDGQYKLTKRGDFIVSIFKAVGKLYNVDERFIDPKIIQEK